MVKNRKVKPSASKAVIPVDLKSLIGTTVSKVQYMDYKPSHFVTNILNPLCRYGDKPYVLCRKPWCGKIVTSRGRDRHEKHCKPPEWYEDSLRPKETAKILKLVPKEK